MGLKDVRGISKAERQFYADNQVYDRICLACGKRFVTRIRDRFTCSARCQLRIVKNDSETVAGELKS